MQAAAQPQLPHRTTLEKQALLQLLTISERRVARYLLTGASSKSIAEELKVSEKTIKFHLSSIYRKIFPNHGHNHKRASFISMFIGEQIL